MSGSRGTRAMTSAAIDALSVAKVRVPAPKKRKPSAWAIVKCDPYPTHPGPASTTAGAGAVVTGTGDNRRSKPAGQQEALDVTNMYAEDRGACRQHH